MTPPIETPQLAEDLRLAHKDGRHGKLVFGCSLCAERAKPVDLGPAQRTQAQTVRKHIEQLYNFVDNSARPLEPLINSLDDEFTKLLVMLGLGD